MLLVCLVVAEGNGREPVVAISADMGSPPFSPCGCVAAGCRELFAMALVIPRLLPELNCSSNVKTLPKQTDPGSEL